MLKQLTDAQKQALAERLSHAKQYEGLHEVDNADELRPLIAKAPGGSNLNLAVDGWCAHFVGSIDAELGYAPYGGRAAEIGAAQVEIDPSIAPSGCTVAFHGHAAFLDDVPSHIFGGNQSNKVNSLHMRYFGEPIGYFIPKEIAERITASSIVEDSPIRSYEYRHKVEGGSWSPWKPCDADMPLSKCSDDDIIAEYTRRFGDPLEVGAEDTESEPEPELPEGTISGDALSEALLHQVIIPHDCREKVWSIDEGKWIEGLSPARFTDSEYKLPTREELDEAVRITKVDEMAYVAEVWDCDDFARRFVSKMHDQGIKTAGRVKAWSGNHAFNIVAIQGDPGDPVEFIFVEPQTDRIVEPNSEDKYNISNALIIIS